MTVENPDTIEHDVSDDGFDAFLSSFDDDPKKQGPSEEQEGAPETTEETAEETGENTEGEPDKDAEPDPDDAEVEIKVGEETKKATLRELKRLYGQEAALTQKSQKLADAQREADANHTRAGTALKAMLDRAKERHAPYASWGAAEWAQLAVSMSTEDYNTLRADAARAEADVKFIEQELDGHIRAENEQAAKARQEATMNCLKTLQDSKSPLHIENFDQPLYNDMMTFADSLGIPQARQVIDPGAIKVLHMAMLYAKGQQAAKAAEAKVKKVVENPKRVLKPGASGQNSSNDGKRAAMKALRESGGDLDSTADAFLASF